MGFGRLDLARINMQYTAPSLRACTILHFMINTATRPRIASASNSPSLSSHPILRDLATCVRSLRSQQGLTRRDLAVASGVSERHLAQLEQGAGNVSVALLARIAAALHAPLAELFQRETARSFELALIHSLLKPLPEHKLARIRSKLAADLNNAELQRQRCVALIGLRGGGKSTLGARLGKHYQVPFIELDREVEREAGTALSEIFLLYGQSGYLRLERQVLERVLEENARAIIATGGSIVTDPGTYDLLLASCFTVWVKAAPEEHMARVLAQGDFRPMQGNARAMKELQRILELREPLYRQADVVIDTHARSAEQSFRQLLKLLEQKS